MGLFDDDTDYDHPSKPGRSEPKPGGMERRHGISRGDVLRSELGGGWTKKQVGVVAALLLVAGIMFVLHFGTNTSTIADQVKQSLGQQVAPLPARVLSAPTVTAITVRYLEGGAVNVGQARLVGLTSPGRCYNSAAGIAHVLPARALVTLTFTAQGRTDPQGRLLVVLTRQGRNENLALLRVGAARLDAQSAKASGSPAAYERAAASARSARRGLWAHCR